LIGLLIWAGVVTLFGVSTTAVDVTDCVFSAVFIFNGWLTVVVVFVLARRGCVSAAGL
jgi:hypothetical protein